MTKTTTFTQYVGDAPVIVTVPCNKVDALMARVDRLIDKNKLEDVISILEPYNTTSISAVPAAKSSKTSDVIEETRHLGRYATIEALVRITGMSKASAYYHVRKAGVM